MNAAEHFAAAQASLDALPTETAETFEEHAANVEIISRASVHAQLALADRIDDLTRIIEKYVKS